MNRGTHRSVRCSELIQPDFEHLQGWGMHYIFGQTVPVFRYPFASFGGALLSGSHLTKWASSGSWDVGFESNNMMSSGHPIHPFYSDQVVTTKTAVSAPQLVFVFVFHPQITSFGNTFWCENGDCLQNHTSFVLPYSSQPHHHWVTANRRSRQERTGRKGATEAPYLQNFSWKWETDFVPDGYIYKSQCNTIQCLWLRCPKTISSLPNHMLRKASSCRRAFAFLREGMLRRSAVERKQDPFSQEE